MNVLLIHSDQHRYDCIRANGIRNDIQTPHLDRLCAEGTRFTRAYSTIPICTPARASLITGAWPTTHGCYCIPTAELDRAARPELPTIYNLLKAQGYTNKWVGKYHKEMDMPDSPGLEQGVDEYVNPWQHRLAMREGRIPAEPTTNGLFGDENDVTPAEQHSIAWQADHVIRMLNESKDDPFFIRWDPPEPHLPCRPSSEFAGRYSAADMQPWQSFPDSLKGKPSAQKRQRKIWGIDDWQWEDWQPVVRLYYGAITELDHHIGRVIDALDQLQLAEDTLVIYSTDHGDYCGGHGQMDKHFNMYEDVVRVPLIIRHPGKVPAGTTAEGFCSNSIDIARTILEATGIEIPDTFIGENLIDLAQLGSQGQRDVAYSQYFGTETGAYSCRMVRDARYKFVYHPTGDCHEFYDLETDPGELDNRINDDTLRIEIKRLKAKLWDVMESTGDRLANAWTAVELKGKPSLAKRE